MFFRTQEQKCRRCCTEYCCVVLEAPALPASVYHCWPQVISAWRLHPTSVPEVQGAGRILREISSPGQPRAQVRESPTYPHNLRAAPLGHQHFTDSTHPHRPIFSALHLKFSTPQTERGRALFHVSSRKRQGLFYVNEAPKTTLLLIAPLWAQMALENMNQVETVDLTQSFWPITNPVQELELSNSVAQLLFIYLLLKQSLKHKLHLGTANQSISNVRLPFAGHKITWQRNNRKTEVSLCFMFPFWQI